MSEKKTRSGKITKIQKVKLLDLMKNNKKVAMGNFGGPNSASHNRNVWEAVAVELNAAGGACKTAEQWKKSWADWKCAVKKQQAEIKRFQNRTGNLPASGGPAPLEEIEPQGQAIDALLLRLETKTSVLVICYAENLGNYQNYGTNNRLPTQITGLENNVNGDSHTRIENTLSNNAICNVHESMISDENEAPSTIAEDIKIQKQLVQAFQM
ncbi:uncharacterized protein LOC118745421 [Rhagoletis pomonella]|uniref:uncharacterized protein LOC118745421 n=1 Tax=Rhagoletis pomonella TaxID=28610 RepID=UPI00177B5862|nr:uncharacterized protein LOC118745421 [Rhagoletis pomonella]